MTSVPEDTSLSWNGFNLHGNRKSIDEAKRLVQRVAALEVWIESQQPSKSEIQGHKLITKITPTGSTNWTCECGKWYPKSADAPFHVAPRDSVIAYIEKMHKNHVKYIEELNGSTIASNG